VGDLAVVGRMFPTMEVIPQELCAVAGRFLPARWVRSALNFTDRRLFATVPRLAHWCRYVTVKLVRPA